MYKIITISLFILCFSCFAQDYDGNGQDLDTPPSNEGTEVNINEGEESPSVWNFTFPIRPRKLELTASYSRYELDVINNFGNHLYTKSTKEISYQAKVYFRFFFDWLDITGSYWNEDIKFEQNSVFVVEEADEFEHYDYKYGLNLHLTHINVELGLGKHRMQTFLETDTSRYYTFEMKDSFYYLNFSTLIPTKFYADIWISVLLKKYKKSENEVYRMDRGLTREWNVGVLFGSTYQIGPYVTYGYENFKYTHNFFGLMNEMSTKFHYRNIGLYFSINM